MFVIRLTARQGYIAIVTSIIVSLIILLVSAIVGSSSFMSRASDVDHGFEYSSYYFAQACTDQALLGLALDVNYAGNETLAISGTQECTIRPVITSGANKIIQAYATTNGVTTNLQLTVVALDLDVVSLEEVKNF